MNIAAAMASLKVGGVDDKAKHALLVLASRCPDRHTWTVTRSLPKLAADMGVSKRTAQRAVLALERKGYLQVMHRLGTSSTYTFGTSVRLAGVTSDNVTRVPVTYPPVTSDRLAHSRRKTRDKQESGSPLARLTAAAPPVENGADPSTWNPTRCPHPTTCRCEGVGFLEVTPGRFAPCEP